MIAGASELADLDAAVSHNASPLHWFSRVAPLMMFLRNRLGPQVWHNENPTACIVIDDPLLRSRHGFLNYRQLLDSMSRLKFATNLAFIPWNYRRSDPETAGAFLASTRAPRLCVHGCDHTQAEFATRDKAALLGKARLALERMREHSCHYGVAFDPVMVFPQGLFSIESLSALRDAGFVAAVNTDLWPAFGDEALSLRDLLDVAVTRWAHLPLFGRRYPRDIAEFAFDLFLGKPAIAVEHHGYFRDGQRALESFVGMLNRLDERLEWTNIGSICTRASLVQHISATKSRVRFFSPVFSLTNPGTDVHEYQLVHPDNGASPTVSIDGMAPSSVRTDNHGAISLSLMPGQSATVTVATPAPISAPSPTPLTYSVTVAIRRWLCEFRDNHIHTNRLLDTAVTKARSLFVNSRASLRATRA
jgi:hypothetical protein